MASKPNFFERAIATVSPSTALYRAACRDQLVNFGYDAANPGTLRGGSGGMGKNAGSETPKMAMDRIKLMWEARDLERNMPVIRCVLDRLCQYVVSQIVYQASSGDPEWDKLAEAYLQHWFENVADLTGRRNFRMLIELAFRSMLRDGDFGFYLVRVGSDLRLQCIEADRIGDPSKVANQLEDDLVQGIHLGPYGEPVGYDIFKRGRKSNQYTFEVTADAKNFFFLSKPLRTDEYRSVSWLAPIVGQARDLYEMFGFERGAAKWAASHAGIIKVTDPLAKAGAGSAGMWDGASKTAGGDPTVNVQGNKLLRLRPNEDVTVFNTGSRPSGSFMAYIEASLRDIAMGLNIPYGFFNMAQFGGATVRLEAMQLQRLFNRYQELLTASLLNPIKREILSNAIATGQLPPNDNFANGRWQFGKHLTADTGYDTDANIQLLQNGLKSAQSIAGEEGFDYEDLVDSLIKEATILRDKCAQAGVPVEFIAAARFPDATNQLAAVADALQPPAPTTVESLGANAKLVTELLEKVAGGIIPREEAISLLVEVFEISPEVAANIVPEVQKIAVEANKPPAPFGGKPKGKPTPDDGEKEEDGEDEEVDAPIKP